MSKIRNIAVCVALLLVIPVLAHAQSLNADQRAALQQELAQVEAEQKQAEADLTSAKAESSSLSQAIKVLDAKIKSAQLEIKAKNLLIQTLGDDIASKQGHIEDLQTHIEKGRETLSQLMRKTNELDDHNMAELMLSQSSISTFFNDVDTFQAVQAGLKTTFEELRADQNQTQQEKDALDERRNAELDARHAIEVAQANIQSDQKSKQQLLSISKNNEKAYTTLVAQKQDRAAQIRAALFALAGGSSPIPFGDALQYAQAASAKTGVDPAFLLAILTQESNLGKNVGNCYISNIQTGAGINVKTNAAVAKVMHPTRDIPSFITLTRALNRDPMQTVVSCPQAVGWGGAMGPAQFIASTWDLITSRVQSLLGISATPDPWNPKHAIMAEASFMADLGAASNSYSAKMTAACRYFGGGTKCTTVTRPYGTSVMALADSIQRNQINVLQGL